MDDLESLQTLGEIDEPGDEVFARAQQVLIDYLAGQLVPSGARPRRRRRWLLAGGVSTAAIAVAALVIAAVVLGPATSTEATPWRLASSLTGSSFNAASAGIPFGGRLTCPAPSVCYVVAQSEGAARSPSGGPLPPTSNLSNIDVSPTAGRPGRRSPCRPTSRRPRPRPA